ncbi:phage tail protein [Paenibacillus larvae]|uniref:Phage tail protein n=2 Tax=Paenibacillus larvae TaxID=1464 RepID=A0AAP5JSB3_9BACL|nr:phage tail protein [Paenibacillus larvae]MCY9687632.1 phage tail protein [Paenibacillus larvae]MDT2231209.1 phage tail protein [Paenibacillus larvae]MDT2234649.1 phage tail protein [Paenibacillus larvae]MDT2243237.1 phage tail protein [Paenibacillus larvae]MDT2248074.1 phage tail protein [Paenibacillus larvae]
MTTKGRNLQAKAQTGVELKYTRVGIGDGQLAGQSILLLDKLINEKKSLPITKLNIQTAGKAVVGTVLSNQEVTTGFYFREIGIYAQDPSAGEILYAYGNSGENAEYIPPAGGADVVEKSIDVIVIVGNAQTVTAEIDKSLVYATVEDLEQAKKEAKQYTDEKSAEGKQYTDQKGTQTLDEAMKYTDQKTVESIQTANQFTEEKLTEAKQYTDQKGTQTLDEAKKYADQKDSKVLSDAKQYTDQKVGSIYIPVKSVNGKTGNVTINASDVGAVTFFEMREELRKYAFLGEPRGQMEPSFQNGWYIQAGDVKGVCYYKDQFGYVFLYGTCEGGKTDFGTTLFNLPAGYRPSGIVRIGATMINWEGYARSIQFLGIYPSGDVLIESNGLPGKVTFSIFPSAFYGQR